MWNGTICNQTSGSSHEYETQWQENPLTFDQALNIEFKIWCFFGLMDVVENINLLSKNTILLFATFQRFLGP
jgi:hypothetical protein